MSVLFIALPIAILLGGAGMFACVMCIRSGQYDDMDTPPIRILIDEHPKKKLVRDSESQSHETPPTANNDP